MELQMTVPNMNQMLKKSHNEHIHTKFEGVDFRTSAEKINKIVHIFTLLPRHLLMTTRYVDGTPMSEVTPVTIRYIRPSQHGHTSQYHGHEWMTHILFVPCQSAVPFLR